MVSAESCRLLVSYRTLARVLPLLSLATYLSPRVAKLSSSIGQTLALALEPDLDNYTQSETPRESERDPEVPCLGVKRRRRSGDG